MAREGYVYILASRRNGTLYVGVTANLAARVQLHKSRLVEGFSSRYSVCRLVWFERHSSIYQAISREKAIKKWRRKWKLALIEASNPEWRDLYRE